MSPHVTFTVPLNVLTFPKLPHDGSFIDIILGCVKNTVISCKLSQSQGNGYENNNTSDIQIQF